MTQSSFPAETGAQLAQLAGTFDARMIALMRCVLAFSGLAFIYIDPHSPKGLGAPTYSALLAYCVWGAGLLYWTARGSGNALPPRFAHWGDVLFSAYLETLTQGINSVFFAFFLFSILVASFSRGFREGLQVTGAAVFLFMLVGLRLSPDAVFKLDPLLIQPIYLLTLGYMIAYWGGHEVEQRRRLRLLHGINTQWNPRLGYDHALGTNLERTLDYFAAATCVLVLKRSSTAPAYLSYHAAAERKGQATLPRAIDAAAGSTLLGLPADFSAFHEHSSPWVNRVLPLLRRMVLLPVHPPERFAECSKIGDLLDAPDFLTVPFDQRDGALGRVFLTRPARPFSRNEVAFAGQLVTAISRVVESVQLIDELVSKAADHERYRISLDIHDTTIQPYVGLKLGLDALHRRTGADNPLSRDISELRDMAETTIRDLRRYTATLRDDTPLAGATLVTAIGQQAEQFRRFYGIDVSVDCEPHLQLSARLGNAVLHILAESLSNILRHSQAKTARVSLYRRQQTLTMQIANPTDGVTAPDFTPRSIQHRVTTLGGTCTVQHDERGYTLVQLAIPL